MELSEYIDIVMRYRRTFLIILLASIVLAGLFSLYRSAQSQASFSLIIRPRALAADRFQFSDMLEASDRVTSMTANWLQGQAGNVNVSRLGNQFIRVSLDSAREASAKQIQADILKRTNGFLASLAPTQDLGSFEALVSDFSFGHKNPYWLLSISLGAFAGLVIGFFATLLRHYLAPLEKSRR